MLSEVSSKTIACTHHSLRQQHSLCQRFVSRSNGCYLRSRVVPFEGSASKKDRCGLQGSESREKQERATDQVSPVHRIQPELLVDEVGRVLVPVSTRRERTFGWSTKVW